MDQNQDSLMKLKQLSQYVSYFIEGNVSAELLAALTTLLQTHKRIITFNGNSFDLPFLKKRYEINHIKQPFSDTQSVDLYRESCHLNLVKKIISEGQKKGEIRTDISVEELAHDVLVLERGIIMDWCVQNGSFSLGYYGSRSFDLYIEFMRVG